MRLNRYRQGTKRAGAEWAGCAFPWTDSGRKTHERDRHCLYLSVILSTSTDDSSHVTSNEVNSELWFISPLNREVLLQLETARPQPLYSQKRKQNTHSFTLESLDRAVPLGQIVSNGLELLQDLLNLLEGSLVLEHGLVVGQVDLGHRSGQRGGLVECGRVSSSESGKLGESGLAETEGGVDLGPVLWGGWGGGWVCMVNDGGKVGERVGCGGKELKREPKKAGKGTNIQRNSEIMSAEGPKFLGDKGIILPVLFERDNSMSVKRNRKKYARPGRRRFGRPW